MCWTMMRRKVWWKKSTSSSSSCLKISPFKVQRVGRIYQSRGDDRPMQWRFSTYVSHFCTEMFSYEKKPDGIVLFSYSLLGCCEVIPWMPPIFIFLLLYLFNHPTVNFINILCACFLYKILVPKSLKAKTKLCNYCRQNFVLKTCAENIDEIDTWSVKSW